VTHCSWVKQASSFDNELWENLVSHYCSLNGNVVYVSGVGSVQTDCLVSVPVVIDPAV